MVLAGYWEREGGERDVRLEPVAQRIEHRGSNANDVGSIPARLTVHIFSDASHKGKLYSGAYLIGDSAPMHVVHPGCGSSTDAEMLTMIAAISEAMIRHADSALVVHTDLDCIHPLLDKHWRLDREPGSTLANYRSQGVQFIPDANCHAKHKVCHRHARIAAGINGYNHPGLVKRGSKQGSAVTAMRRRSVLLRLQSQAGKPISETRLAALCLIPLSAVVRALQWLKNKGRASCAVRANVVDSCDCSQRMWVFVDAPPVLAEAPWHDT